MIKIGLQPGFIRPNSDGFTVIELMIATTIFSVVLTVILASFLQIGRMFYKGVSVNNTHEAARTVVEDISNDIRFAGTYVPEADYGPNSSKFFCIGSHRYIYSAVNNSKKPYKITSGDVSKPDSIGNPRGIIESTIPGGCPAPSPTLPGTNAQQILGPDMQLNAFEFVSNGGSNYRIHVHIVFYGIDDSVFASAKNPDDDPPTALLEPDAYCSSNLLSTQFCAMADLTTSVSVN